MVDLLLSWLVLSAAFWGTAKLLPGFEVERFKDAIIVAAMFGLINWLVGWLLFVILGIASLGLGFILAFVTRWIVNAVLLKVTDAMTSRLTIRSFGTALVGALLISLLGTVGEWALEIVLD